MISASTAPARGLLLALAAAVALPAPVLAQRPGPSTGAAIVGTSTPRPVATGSFAPDSAAAKPYNSQRLRAGHLLRRAGFGPSPADLQTVLTLGPEAWVDQQLNPSAIDDSAAEARFYPVPDPFIDDFGLSHMRHWFTRMTYSRRQLLEKMTLIWHEHMPVSIGKIGIGKPLNDYEEMLRRNALGSFRQLLIELTRDNAMLVYLDNNYNSAFDYDGNPVPPNENYARELLQLFTLGTQRLNMDGTPVRDGNGNIEPNYTEADVRAIARALTGFYIDDYETFGPSKFYDGFHDSSRKTFLGTTIPGRSGNDGAHEVDDVVDVIMAQPSTAPYISKILIQKLATETPTPSYVERVATVFKTTNGNIKATVRAILTDPEFYADANIRTQFKTPIEQYVGAIRALDADSQGGSLVYWTLFTGHLVYYPPSVFSFYRPGKKGALVTASQVTFYDNFADDFVDTYTDEYTDTSFDAEALIRDHNFKKPKKVVKFLEDALLTAPLEPATRQAVVDYMGGRVTPEKVRGAVWLIMTSPDFQLN